MATRDRNVWGIHAGKTGDAENLFFKQNVVALGWHQMGDLNVISPDRSAFRSAIAKTYPESKPGAIPVEAGQLYRFVHEMKIGDLVAYPSKRDRLIHIGEVTGNYQYNSETESRYPHRRSVKWLRELPRTYFKQGTLYGIGSAMSFFSLEDYADEFESAVQGKLKVEDAPSIIDETLSQVSQNIEDNTRDFILKKLSRELKGHPFAHFVGHLLECMGYHTRISPEGTDGGIDIIAHKDELGFEPPIIKVQVKSTDKDIGEPAIRDLSGVIQGTNEFGLFVTLGRFGSKAVIFARGRSNLRLIDGNDLVNLIFQYYEQFDSSYKALIPLKRVYIPEVIEDTGN